MNYFVLIGVLLLLLGVLLLIPAIIMAVTDNKHDKYHSYSIFDYEVTNASIASVLIGIFILIIVFMTTIDINREFENTKKEYAVLKEMVETYKEGNNEWLDKNNVYSVNMYKDIMEMNHKIDKHKIFHDSKWYNLWYSEEIGNLEHIKF